MWQQSKKCRSIDQLTAICFPSFDFYVMTRHQLWRHQIHCVTASNKGRFIKKWRRVGSKLQNNVVKMTLWGSDEMTEQLIDIRGLEDRCRAATTVRRLSPRSYCVTAILTFLFPPETVQITHFPRLFLACLLYHPSLPASDGHSWKVGP